jgi:GWxTD domain-containing protein
MEATMRKKTYILLTVAAAVLIGCGAPQQIKTTPENDPFFETARFIMTKEEVEIYTHLATPQDRREFIEEFWQKRDPSPLTEENENREEFYKRIAYANKWFNEGIKAKGWDTERGRILLQMGFPERREFGEADDVITSGPARGRLRSTKRIPMEQWVYYNHSLTLVFADVRGLGRLELVRIPPNLLTAMDRARFSLDLRNQGNLNQAFRFDVDYREGALHIEIPIDKLTFDEKDGKMVVDFDIKVYVYRDNVRIDTFTASKTVAFERTEIQQLRHVQFQLPYPLKSKGKYYFDVIIEDKGTAARYRNFSKTRR